MTPVWNEIKSDKIFQNCIRPLLKQGGAIAPNLFSSDKKIFYYYSYNLFISKIILNFTWSEESKLEMLMKIINFKKYFIFRKFFEITGYKIMQVIW